MLQRTTSSTAIRPDHKSVITERIRGEFREMPGLTLSLAQACRLWSLDELACGEALTQLVQAGFLCRKADGGFCRASDFTAPPRRMMKAAVELVQIEQPRRLARG
jgi:hypothetical protein